MTTMIKNGSVKFHYHTMKTVYNIWMDDRNRSAA